MLSVAPRVNSVDPFFAELRCREFRRLDDQNLAYLDYGGAALYAESQLRVHHDRLRRGVFGNPHAESGPSRETTSALAGARASVLTFLDADPRDYVVVFTANTSAAIKLVAESFPFTSASVCALSTDNHNSVNGLREYARRAGAAVRYLPLDDDLRICRGALPAAPAGAASLLAFPAQSNFSGVKHPLSLVAAARANGFDVLLDAAAFVSTNALSLREHAPDFVALSFYKVFGYPTGVGALIARREALSRLRRPWFAGGTVDFASVQNATHQLRPLAEGFEDGTPDFLSIGGLDPGFVLMHEVGMDRLAAHTTRLVTLLVDEVMELSHDDGAPLVRLYGPPDMRDRGATVAFNVLDRGGLPIPYAVVEDRARARHVALRGGCFCNPGASERAFGFDAPSAAACLRTASDGGFTIPRFSACMGSGMAVGAIRASLGLANNVRDVYRAIDVVASFRC